MHSWGIITLPCDCKKKKKRSEVQRAAVCLLYLCTLPWLCAFSKGYLYLKQHEIAAGPVKDVRGWLCVPLWSCIAAAQGLAAVPSSPFAVQLDTSGGSRVCKHTGTWPALCLVPGILRVTSLAKDPWIKERAWTWSWPSLWGPEAEVNSGELCEEVVVKSGKLLLWLCLNSSCGSSLLEQLSLLWVSQECFFVGLCHSRSLVLQGYLLCGKNGATSSLSLLKVVWDLIFPGDYCAGGQGEAGNSLNKSDKHRVTECEGVGRGLKDHFVPNPPAMGRDTCH